MRDVAGRDRGDCGVEILDSRTFQILRLETLAGKAPSGSAVIAERATDAIVAVGAGKQRVDLLDRRLSAAEPEFQHAAHGRRKRIVAEQLFDRLAIELSVVQPCCCNHRRKLGTWLALVTAPPVSSAISASISGAAACAIRRAASANDRSK